MRRVFLAAGLLLVAGALGAPAARAADLPPSAPAPGLMPTCLGLDARLGLFQFRLGLGVDPYLGQRLRDRELLDRLRLQRDLERGGPYGGPSGGPYGGYEPYGGTDPCRVRRYGAIPWRGYPYPSRSWR